MYAWGSQVVPSWRYTKTAPASSLSSSPVGKRLILQDDGEDWHGFSDENADLVGKEGVAHTTLRPAGTAVVDGVRVDVVTRGEMLEAQTAVKVIEVEGNRVVVTALDSSGN